MLQPEEILRSLPACLQEAQGTGSSLPAPAGLDLLASPARYCAGHWAELRRGPLPTHSAHRVRQRAQPYLCS